MRRIFLLGFMIAMASNAFGIGPQNILIVAAHKSPESLAVANYYAEKRGIPKSHIARIPLPPLEAFDPESFRKHCIEVVEKHIRDHGLEDRISVWVTTSGCPPVLKDNGASGMIYFGGYQSVRTGVAQPGTYEAKNEYFDRALGYRRPEKATAGGYLHMHLDVGSFEATKALIDRSIQADGTNPDGTVYLMDGVGPRSSRKVSIPLAEKLLTVLGRKVKHLPGVMPTGAQDVIGLYTGEKALQVRACQYLPGALADHLTSFGGRLRTYRGQTSASDFVRAGCSASYGTVVEPYNYPAKFPTAQLHVYYALGFTAVESYWMSVLWPQQGLFVGDPLTRPFLQAPTLAVEGLDAGQVASATLDFQVVGNAPDNSGIASIVVRLDGAIVHQVGAPRVPEGTKYQIAVGDKKVEYTAGSSQLLGDVIGAIGEKASAAGIQVSIRPGLLFILQPSGSGSIGELIATSNSAAAPVEILGKKVSEGTPTAGAVSWPITGRCAAGDVFSLTLREKDKEIARFHHEITFSRPAATIATSLRLEWQSKLPDGYKFENEVAPNKPEFGILRVVASQERIPSAPSATLVLTTKAGSKLSVDGNGVSRGFAGPGLAGFDIGCVRFSLGPRELRTHPRIDTEKFPDGRHWMEIVATLGSATDASCLASMPIVIRNGKRRLELKSIRSEFSVRDTMPTEVARVELPPRELANLRYYVDGNEIPPNMVRQGTLLFEPFRWGPGPHGITARLKEDGKDVLFSDNEIVVQIQAP